jgi:aspartate/methionine/tyrosine aminotransferase
VRFVEFELERWQSTWENRVRYNLSESGVHPLSIAELLELAGSAAAELLQVRLGYSQSNGTDLLRSRIAALYPGVSPEQILVTTGSAEANFVVCWRLIEPGDTVAVMLPNYLQTWGLAQNFGAQVRSFTLHAAAGWEPEADEVRRAIAPGTKLVVVTNPHNPTGHVLSDELRRVIVTRAAEVGAWLLADEVYQGAERDGVTTPSLWGSYERVIVVNGLSKAYGLPGLRIGWIVAPPQLSSAAWARHDYTTIGPAGASDHLAAVTLEPTVRARAASSRPTTRCSSAGSSGSATRSAGTRHRPGRSASSSTATRSAARNWWSGCAPSTACCSCRASISACRTTSASGSARSPTTCKRRSRRPSGA